MYEFAELEKIALVAVNVPEKQNKSKLNTSINADSPEEYLKKHADKIRNTPDGNRNHQVNLSAFLVGGVVEQGKLEHEEARRRLTESGIDSGLGEDEAMSTVKSGMEAGIEKANLPPDAPGWWGKPIHQEVIDIPPFPVEHLPKPIRDFVETVAEFTQTPADLAGLLCLAAVATVCGRLVKVQVRGDWYEQVNLFVLVIHRPGTRKSSVYRLVLQPIKDYEAEEAKRLSPEIAEATMNRNILDEKKRVAEKKAANNVLDSDLEDEIEYLIQEIDDCKIPRSPRFLAEDCSQEKLTSLMAENDGCIALVSAEGGGIFDMIGGRYGKDGRSNLDVYLKGHAGDQIIVDRISRGPEHISEATLTMALTAQPEVLENLGKKSGFLGRGLLARFIYALPKDMLGSRVSNPPTIPYDIKQKYYDLITSILKLPVSRDGDGQLDRHILQLDERAKKHVINLMDRIEPHLDEDGSMSHMTDWGGKCAGAVVRIAGLFHMVEHATSPAPWNILISGDTMSRAIHIGRYCLQHATAAYREYQFNDDEKDVSLVLTWIIRKNVPEFSARDAFQKFSGRFRNMDRFNTTLKCLTERNIIRPQEMEEKKGPGRPSKIYSVNPALLNGNKP